MICCLGDQEFSSCVLKLDPCTCGKLWLALRYCITAEGEFCLGFEGGCVWLRRCPSPVALLKLHMECKHGRPASPCAK